MNIDRTLPSARCIFTPGMYSPDQLRPHPTIEGERHHV